MFNGEKKTKQIHTQTRTHFQENQNEKKNEFNTLLTLMGIFLFMTVVAQYGSMYCVCRDGTKKKPKN